MYFIERYELICLLSIGKQMVKYVNGLVRPFHFNRSNSKFISIKFKIIYRFPDIQQYYKQYFIQ